MMEVYKHQQQAGAVAHSDITLGSIPYGWILARCPAAAATGYAQVASVGSNIYIGP